MRSLLTIFFFLKSTVKFFLYPCLHHLYMLAALHYAQAQVSMLALCWHGYVAWAITAGTMAGPLFREPLIPY